MRTLSPTIATVIAAAFFSQGAAAQSLGVEGPSGQYVMFSGQIDTAFAKVVNKDATGASASVTELHQSGSLGSILRWRGREELGGGLYTGFWLETAIIPQTGAIAPGPFFNRSSAVYLGNEWGELALGEVRVPTYSNMAFHDPSGNNGHMAGTKLLSSLGTSVNSLFQNINSVNYFLPKDAGGFYGHIQATLGEGQPNQKYGGGQLGYAKGAFDVAIASGSTQTTAGNPNYKMTNLAGAYNFDVLKLVGYVVKVSYGVQSENMYVAGMVIPVGADTIRLSYSGATFSGGALAGAKASSPGVQYIHAFSKRTAVYVGMAQIKNSGNAAFRLSPSALTTSTLGGSSTGFDVGIRHTF